MYRNKDLNYIMSCIEKSLDEESGNQISEAAKRIDEQHDKMNAVVEAGKRQGHEIDCACVMGESLCDCTFSFLEEALTALEGE